MHQNSHVNHILAADIGGTHSRFALFSLNREAATLEAGLSLVRRVRFATTECSDSADMMRRLAATPGDDGGFLTPGSPVPQRVDAAVLGIPGPTRVANPSLPPPAGEVCRCPNIVWPMEAAVVADALGGASVRFINDFVGNGFACALLPHVVDAVSVLGGENRPDFPCAVVGAGTGLGHCLIVPGDPPTVLGSEGGHNMFPFAADEEDLSRHFAKMTGNGRSNGDMTVTGSGLARLYAYCAGEELHPHDVPALAAKHPAALALIARLYGRAVCHYALATLSLGGVFITGGLAANLPQALSHPEFVAEIRERNSMSHILRGMPVFQVRNQNLGLWGAAACAALSLR